MNLMILIAAFLFTCLLNVLYFLPKIKRSKTLIEELRKINREIVIENETIRKELNNYKKSLFRAVDIHRRLKNENIELKEKNERQKEWLKFLEKKES